MPETLIGVGLVDEKKFGELLGSGWVVSVEVGYNLDFNFITNQKGMFSFLGISKEQINTLKNKHAIYMVDSSRINIAGLNSNNLEFFVKGIKAVV